MNINTITAEDLRRMPDKEGLILQGCGGDLTEWVDGINEMLTNAGILKDGSQFENVFAFQHGELTCLLYPFDDVKLDIGKLALWRLQTHTVFQIPGYYKYGSIKGRVFMYIPVAGFLVTLLLLSKMPAIGNSIISVVESSPILLILLVVFAIVVMYAVSIFLSIRVMKNKEM